MELTTTDAKQFLAIQLGISAVLNALISALFVWIVFRGQDRIGLWGGKGLAADLVPTTFMITLMSAIALTIATRSAVRSGKVEARTGAWRLPRNPALRGLTLAFAATLILVPLSVAALAFLWESDWSYRTVMAFKIGYGVVLGTIVTPIIVYAALGDRRR